MDPTDLAHGSVDAPGRDQLDLERLEGQIVGPYRVIERIGSGGMSYVYRAEHLRLGRQVALKVLRPECAAQREVMARFVREARAIGRIRHRNIIDVTDFVELRPGIAFLVMELIDGASLSDLLRQPEQLPVRKVIGLLLQICDGLGAAHEAGFVHRDLKPANILLTRTAAGEDLIKILDFGVAKWLRGAGDLAPVRTIAGAVIGTPAYMSPEQASGAPPDQRSDIYSLGAILYEMCTRQPVFTASNLGEYLHKHLHEAPVPPRATPQGAAIPVALERIILRCLNKHPADRYQHVRHLRRDLLGVLRPQTAPVDRQRRGNHLLQYCIIATGMACLVFLAIFGLLLWRSRPARSAPPAPPLVSHLSTTDAPRASAHRPAAPAPATGNAGPQLQLRLDGSPAAFLEQFRGAVAPDGAIDLPALMAHSNASFRTASRALLERLRSPDIGLVTGTARAPIAAPGAYPLLSSWLVEQIDAQPRTGVTAGDATLLHLQLPGRRLPAR
jgi:serine/threonine-protein kinase